jgi:hypothetical protein
MATAAKVARSAAALLVVAVAALALLSGAPHGFADDKPALPADPVRGMPWVPLASRATPWTLPT